ncbi:MAG: hypothetical protein LBQ44_05610, partial [Treponema sp.]|nr:hypothetical protein [Treponema sp.]
KVQEINELIRRDISEDAYAVMEQDPHPYTGRNLAEDLETALYLCPVCVQTGTLSSKGNTLYCTCGFRTEYDQYGAFHGTVPEGRRPAADPFATVRDWWLWQEAAMEGIALSAGDGPVCSDEDQELYEIRSASRAELAARGRLTLGTGGLCCGPVRFSLRDIGELAITGQRTITFAAGKKQYELKSRFPRSAAKYKRVFEVLTKKIPSAETSAGAQRED